MGEIFGSIYCVFEELFGLDLAEYLWGEASPLTEINKFQIVGLWMLGISLLVVILFYYVVNHPRLNNWWGWLIFLGVNAIINFIFGWQYVLGDYYDGLMVKAGEEVGQYVPLDIYEDDLLRFGVANMFLAIFVFIIFSFILKWWSKNCSRAPF